MYVYVYLILCIVRLCRCICLLFARYVSVCMPVCSSLSVFVRYLAYVSTSTVVYMSMYISLNVTIHVRLPRLSVSSSMYLSI